MKSVHWLSCVLVQSPAGAQTVSSSERAVRDETYTLPFIQGFGVLSSTMKWLRYEADHSSQSRTDVQNTCSYTSTPLCIFKTWCLNKRRGDFSYMRVCFCVTIFVCVFECAFVWVCNCVSLCLYMFVCTSAYVFECVMCVWVCATQTAMFRDNTGTHLHYHLAQTTQSSVYKNAPNCDVENSVIFCAEHRTDSLRNYGGKKWERMIKDAAIRGLSALSVSCTIRRDAPVARHISVLLSPYFFLVAPTHKTQFRYWMWDSN